jgi:hypothetical protein
MKRTGSSRRRATALVRVAAVGVMLLAPVAAHSRLVPCRRTVDARRIATALGRIQGSVDPCGESAQLLAVLDRLERCATADYEICTSPDAGRNLFERPNPPHSEEPRTITWNPELRSGLERGCDGDPGRPVRRDPTASLLHEIVHAAHDCEGLNPGAYEFEAVRIENIYRRAAGLCQRSRYGDDPLPLDMLKSCNHGRCACAVPAAAPSDILPYPSGPVQPHRPTTPDPGVADSAGPETR